MATLSKAQNTTIAYGVRPVPPTPAYCIRVPTGTDTATRITVTGAYAVELNGRVYRNRTVTAGSGDSYSIFLIPNTTTTYVDTNPLSPTYGKAVTVSIADSGTYTISRSSAVQYEEQCFPARPGVPGADDVVTRTPADGWNAGGHSVERVKAGEKFRAVVPKGTIGAMVGLGDGTIDYGYSHPTHAVLLRNGQRALVVEGGVVKATLSVVGTDVAHTVEIARGPSSVIYYVDGERVHVSALPGTELRHGEAILYAATDRVSDAAIVGWGEGQGYMPVSAPLAYASDADFNAGYVNVSAPQLHGAGAYSGGYNYGGGQVPAPALQAQQAVAPVVILYASGEVVFPAALAVGVTAPYAWGGGQLQAPMPAMVAADVSGYNFGALDTLIQTSIRLTLDTDLPGMKNFAEGVLLIDSFATTAPVMVMFAERLEVGSDVDFLLVFDLAFSERLALDGSGDFFADDALSFAEAIRFSDISAMGRTALTYAVDIVTGALREYSGYEFTHYMNLGSELWAAKGDGLYALGGGVGEALLDIGEFDFGAGQRKYIPTAWVGIRTDGQVYLRVMVDEKEYVYRAAGQGDVQKVTLGKGLEGRNWRMRLEIEEASFASIDSVEFEVGVSQRRTVGVGRGRR